MCCDDLISWQDSRIIFPVMDFSAMYPFQQISPGKIQGITTVVFEALGPSYAYKRRSTLGHHCFNTLRPRQNGRHFADDIFKWIFLNENVCIAITISLKFVPQCPIKNIQALVQIMAWRRTGDKPFSGPMVVRLPTHICVTRPQWVK